jgi:tRNA(Ile)-lysidine synthase TilS/MesJ
MKICRRCVVPAGFPHVTFDSRGVCNMCRDYKGRRTQERTKEVYRKRLKALLDGIRGRGEYDVLACYSGGKDSTYTLNILKNDYRLKVLAFTFDNGFIPERTYVNIRNVVEKLDIDHILFKPRFDLLKSIFKVALEKPLYSAKALERASAVCTSCIGLVKYTALKTAIEKDIPLVAFGWSPGQAPITSSMLKIEPEMIRSMEKVLKKPMRKIAGRDIEAYFLAQRHYSNPEKFPTFIHPLALCAYNEKRILKEVAKLGWKRPAGVEMNATNCLLNPLADMVHIKKYGVHPYILEIATLVREGCMSRREGLRHLPVKKDPVLIKGLKKRLGI